MSNKKLVMIGIQARSTSKRLPGKISAKIGKHTVLGAILYTAKGNAHYLNDRLADRNIQCGVSLLLPEGDPAGELYFDVHKIYGPEDDVLARYKMLGDAFEPDYIVRITADCPMLPKHMLTKVIMTGVSDEYDYLANFFESKDRKLFRLVPDGFECEFFSRKMLNWANESAKDPYDREHVTTIMRTYPEWGKFGVVLPFEDRGSEKLSVDTEKDLENVRKNLERIEEAKTVAEKLFGKTSVHRF